MATPYIKSYTGALRNRKVIALAETLRLSPIYALGHLHSLWYAAMEQQDDGDLTQWSDMMIAASFGRSKEPAELVLLLQQLGLLGYRHPESKEMILGTERLIHDWIDFAGDYLRGRYAGKNKAKLVVIWAKHLREYGGGTDNPRSTESQPDSDHNKLTNLNNPTNQSPSGGCVVGSNLGSKAAAKQADLIARAQAMLPKRKAESA
jgi:hypothetical protein